MPYYPFHQNNSGGHFMMTSTLTHYVIIEAGTADEANDKLEILGGYFNGCETGEDCPCCGDRWYPVWRDEGTPVPMVNDQAPQDYVNNRKNSLWMKPGKNVVVHHADGRVEWF